MRFVTVTYAGVDRPGVVEDAVVALLPYPDLTDVVVAGIDAVRNELAGAERVPFEPGMLRAPLRRFRRDILCTGWNYWDHFEESKGKREGQDVDRPDHPTFFTKGPDVVVGPNDPIAYDPVISAKWDYEAELALVIGKAGRSIKPADALGHVFGYTLANDVSQRDLQRQHGGQWLKGKSIDNTMPLGPWIVTPDELGDPQDVHLQCLVNGEALQDASTKQMAYDIATLISELSFGMTLRPGDLLLTGTPAGIGNAREPQVFLKAGDEVVTRADKIGELRNVLVPQELA
ncbi:2-keto-4-pentenoate hydratase/2-oxohepta-3-ene-1,7-dioic acid hydratase in catechol pathway [Kribbella amoyensis]|uniref:2-keto-4-pentenoate hydratase/2-oxohepta-3-ene-1,7-dioic acid hydratase in catechol pathway n=1 Tax=Kribbella amoyensis TaxID=996641 RepID=A0A561BXZ8_9ACTN|nr:fumarylacetoacetate hydrolase family protein [Kribbella amoyensis]TWD83759.1 2-keto-4-pentenoate hydratase/2-oxohepta-3-ene-1,7-dioic acid hydratase in catechol pathway [Kribbella amoyensis]